MTDPLVSTTWLAERSGSRDLQVVDATWFLPGDGRSGRDEYGKAHIPGAVFFDIDEIADHETDLPHMLPSPDAFAKAAGELGLRRDATIVVYDNQGISSAPRAWWMLRTMGFTNVFVLDGGLPKWSAEGRPVETVVPEQHAIRLESMFNSTLVRDVDAVRRIVQGREAQLVDARAGPRFRGEVAESRPGLRSGHMPGACNLPWAGLLNADGTMKAVPALKQMFEAAGADLSRPIVTTCGSGVSAAVLALALARLGRDDVAVYDGSWTEWGGRTDTEVVTGA